MSLVTPWTIGLVALVGFAAHRASLCTVRAVAEAMSSGTAWMLTSFLKAAAWATAVTGLLVLIHPVATLVVAERVPHAVGLVGAFVFGIGATVNGGCSLSTLQRLVDGDLSMLGTLGAFVGAVFVINHHAASLGIGSVSYAPSFWQSGHELALPLLLVLWLWVLGESFRLWRTAMGTGDVKRYLLAPTYRLSAAAALMGIAAGLLYALQGAWSYTSFARTATLAWLGEVPKPSAWHALLVAAMLAGMAASSWQRRAFAWSNHWHLWPRRLGGGALMGIGGTLVPGGNDTLVLASVPALSAWALASYVAMVAGIAASLLAMRMITGKHLVVECNGDMCR